MTEFFRALGRWLSPYRGRAGLLGLTLLVQLGFENGFALSLKFLIDDAILPRDEGTAVLVMSITAVAAVAYGVAGIVSDRLYADVGSRVLNDIRRDMFAHLQRLPVTVFERLRPGDVASRFSGDLAAVESAMIVSVPTAALSTLGVLFSFAILFTLEWQLALLAAVGLPLAAVFPRVLGGRAGDAAYEQRTLQGGVGDTVAENVSGQVVVKAFGLQRRSLETFDAHLGHLHQVSLRANFLAYLMERTPNLAIVGVHVVVLWAGALLAIDGSISVGSLVSFNGIYLTVSQAVFGITFALPDLVRATAGYRRIQEVLDEAPEDDAPGAEPATLAADIAFREVTFAHAGAPDPVLADVSFEIPHGAFVALVGGSGSGKSTVINMLLRFHDPESGAITVGGRDLRTLDREALRGRMGVVLQETFLFNTTIGENVRLARPQATDQEIEEACRAAGIHDVVSALRDGYATPVGERGGQLSGGQRQRIAIARAILRRPELLILDEATSALDPATEAEVNATLREVARGRTTVSATHRLASVTDADLIVVLEGGRVAELGTHTELLAAGGRYRELWEKQSGITVTDRAELDIDLGRLRELALLASLDDAQLSEVAQMLQTRHLAAGETLFAEGDVGDALYLVARGRVEVVAGSDQRRINVLDDGDHLGEIALLQAERRTAGARALTPTTLLVLRREQLDGLLDRHPGLRAAVERSARERLARDAAATQPGEA